MTSFDVIILLIIGWGAVAGLMRGFVTEVLSLIAWVAAVAVLRLFHTPAAALFGKWTGTDTGGAILAFVVLFAATFFAFRGVARNLGARTRSSIVGPIDRILGLGFGAVKGLIIASLLFLVVNLFFDMVWGAETPKPRWVVASKTTPLLRLSSAAITDFVEKRRHPDAHPQEGYAEKARAALSDLAARAVPAGK